LESGYEINCASCDFGKDDNGLETTLSRKDLILNEGKAVFNMINSIIGAGIIGIPYALNEAGFMMGVALLVVVAVITGERSVSPCISWQNQFLVIPVSQGMIISG
jgi:hypothetical protein